MGEKGRIIPESIIKKLPTAELKPNQFDQDNLPSYEILDYILKALIEREISLEGLVAEGFDSKVVLQVSKLLQIAEYKRRQSPPGIKITNRSFGRERRYPITNQFSERV